MQEDITIKLNSKTKVYGIFLKPKDSTNRLIIFIHGFLSNQEHHLIHNAAHYFCQRGYNTFRYNLYGYQNDARKTNSTSFRTLARDLSKIVSKFKGQYSKITLVAHSLGAFIALLTRTSDISGLILWEPSLHPKEMFKNVKKDGFYNIFDLGYEARIHQNAIASMFNLPTLQTLLGKIHKPIAIISAEKTGKKIGEHYYTLASEPKKFSVISGAGHNFDEVDTESQLFKLTLEWSKDRKLSP